MKISRRVLAMGVSIALLAFMSPKAGAAADEVGVRRMRTWSQERGTSLDIVVWYPAMPGGRTIVLGESPFFVGTSARLDAPIRPGRHPVVLLSHGAGLAGRPEALSWMAAPLAERGFIVAAPTHPGNTGPDRSARETMKLWLRPADVVQTLDAVEQDPALESHIALNDVGVLGLSMGGSTALALVGATFDPKALAAYCDTEALNPSLCGWVRQSKVDLHALDMRDAGRDNRDKRIRFAMAIDPAPVDVFYVASLGTIDIPVALVNLGRPEHIPITVLAADAAKRIPKADYTVVEDASHFSMFAACKPGGAALAASEDIEDPICQDGGGASRLAIHARLIDLAVTALNRVLRPEH